MLCIEHPQFVKEPERHITAEMEKVVDIPCQARGECVCNSAEVDDFKTESMQYRVEAPYSLLMDEGYIVYRSIWEVFLPMFNSGPSSLRKRDWNGSFELTCTADLTLN